MSGIKKSCILIVTRHGDCAVILFSTPCLFLLYSLLCTRTGKYPRAASSRNASSNNEEDIGKVTIPTTKLIDIDAQNDCTEENIAATFKKMDITLE